MSERPPPAASAAPARQSMAKVVGEKIRGQILDGKLRPGERLVEDRLSAELGVSRVPVREALRELSAEGLVRIERNRGASVTEVTPAMVAELVEVRALLEGLNARLAAQRHDPEIVRQLGEVLKHGNKAADAGSTEQLARLNAEFHDRLAEASRNAVLSDVMRGRRERRRFGVQARHGRQGPRRRLQRAGSLRDRKSTRLNSSHIPLSRMPSSA